MTGEKIKRGDVFLVQLDPTVGSEQGGLRPAVIIQNDIGNEFSPTVIVAPFTTKRYSQRYPTNAEVKSQDSNLKHDSTILLNQIKTIDKRRLQKKLTHLKPSIISQIDRAIKISLGLIELSLKE